VLAVMPGQRESTESWSALLRDVKSCGLVCPRLAEAFDHMLSGKARFHVDLTTGQ
jgi:hypothetical protein